MNPNPDELNSAIAGYVASLSEDARRSMLAQRLRTLRSYARRVVLENASLSPDEETDRKIRMREFLAAGESLGYTERQLVKMVYRGVFAVKPGCDCLICRTVAAQ
ncbi:MAG: hypothetical protein L0177_13950 [Chloroflexi bacterium]|nr:hypothetical protein [Chloroflexota bacterium]